MQHTQALIRYVDELGLGDSANDLKKELIAVAAKSGSIIVALRSLLRKPGLPFYGNTNDC